MINCPLSDLVPFQQHTFKVEDDEKMLELVSSIQQNGILVPPLVFENENGDLELVSGHRRKRACEIAGMTEIPVLIRDFTRDAAIVAMGESNLQQRESILPSERAYTYRVMVEALNRQGIDNNMTDAAKKESVSKQIEKKTGDSKTNVYRYIRLTYLIPDILGVVDLRRIGIKPAVELSYLPSNLQKCVYEFYQEYDVTPSHAQAIQMHKLADNNILDEAKIEKILMEEKGNQKVDGYKVSDALLKKYFADCKNRIEIEQRLIEALDLLEKQKKIEKRYTKESYQEYEL